MPGFSDKLMGLLSDPRTMDIGMGLLSAGGPSFTPHNMGQDMAGAYQYANSREGERAQLEMQRMQMAQQKKQQAARAQIGQIYANTQTPQQIGQGVAGQMGILGAGAGMLNPQTQAQYVRANQGLNAINNQRQQQIPGLLSEAYPEQYAAEQMKGLFGAPQPQLSSGVRDFAAMSGMQPTDPRFMAAYQQYQVDSKPIDPSKQLADQLAGQQIQANLDDQAANAQLTATELRTQGTGRTRSMEEIGKIVGLMEDVEGTAVQPGIIAESVGNANQLIAAITDAFGGDATNSRRLATQYGTLNKGFDRLVNRVLPTTFTNSVFEFIKGQNMGVGQELGVNADIMISTIKQVLDDDFNSDGDYDLDRDSAQAMIVRLEAMRDRALGNETPEKIDTDVEPRVSTQAQFDAIVEGMHFWEDGVRKMKTAADSTATAAVGLLDSASTNIPAFLLEAKAQAEEALNKSGIGEQAKAKAQSALDEINRFIDGIQ